MLILKFIYSNFNILFSLSAKKYAIAYLLLIPFFSSIYYFNHKDFYQSNNSYDSKTEREILNTLRYELINILIKHVNYYAVTNYKEKCNTYDSLKNFGIEEKDLRVFQKTINNMTMSSPGLILGKRSFKKDFDNIIKHKFIFFFMESGDIQNYKNSFSELNETQKMQLITYIANSGLSVEGHIYYQKHVPDTYINIDKYSFESKCDLKVKDIFKDHVISEFNNKETKKVRVILDDYDGFLSGELTQYGNTYSNIIKMFYLSVVTITTLGYGDIVPTTNFTRLLVSIESILGIILIGLFLNALAKKN